MADGETHIWPISIAGLPALPIGSTFKPVLGFTLYLSAIRFGDASWILDAKRDPGVIWNQLDLLGNHNSLHSRSVAEPMVWLVIELKTGSPPCCG